MLPNHVSLADNMLWQVCGQILECARRVLFNHNKTTEFEIRPRKALLEEGAFSSSCSQTAVQHIPFRPVQHSCIQEINYRALAPFWSTVNVLGQKVERDGRALRDAGLRASQAPAETR